MSLRLPRRRLAVIAIFALVGFMLLHTGPDAGQPELPTRGPLSASAYVSGLSKVHRESDTNATRKGLILPPSSQQTHKATPAVIKVSVIDDEFHVVLIADGYREDVRVVACIKSLWAVTHRPFQLHIIADDTATAAARGALALLHANATFYNSSALLLQQATAVLRTGQLQDYMHPWSPRAQLLDYAALVLAHVLPLPHAIVLDTRVRLKEDLSLLREELSRLPPALMAVTQDLRFSPPRLSPTVMLANFVAIRQSPDFAAFFGAPVGASAGAGAVTWARAGSLAKAATAASREGHLSAGDVLDLVRRLAPTALTPLHCTWLHHACNFDWVDPATAGAPCHSDALIELENCS